MNFRSLRGRARRWALGYPRSDKTQWTRPLARPDSCDTPSSVTVALPHWEAPTWCHATIESIISQASVHLCVVVIDNSGNLGKIDDIERGVGIHRPAVNLGFAGAVNHVLERWVTNAGDDEFLLVVSHDCEFVNADTIALLAHALRACPDVGIIGPAGSGEPQAISGAVYVTGTCLMMRRQCARDVGMFDTELGTYDEDLDFCLRAWDTGWLVATIGGNPIRTHGSIAVDRTRRVARNHVILANKRSGRIGAIVETTIQLKQVALEALAAATSRGVRRAAFRREASLRRQGALGGLRYVMAVSDRHS